MPCEKNPSRALPCPEKEDVLQHRTLFRCFRGIHSAFFMSTGSILSGKLFAWLIAWVLAHATSSECDRQRIPRTHRATQITRKIHKTHPAHPYSDEYRMFCDSMWQCCPSPAMSSLRQKTPRALLGNTHGFSLSLSLSLHRHTQGLELGVCQEVP